jgi:hypothetical protein
MEKIVKEAIALLEGLGYTVSRPDIVQERDNTPSFKDWWNLYDKKRGRKKAEAKWERLKDSDKRACYEATPAYVASVENKQFQKDPLTYLNGECWNDEIIDGNINQRKYNESASLVNEFLSVK